MALPIRLSRRRQSDPWEMAQRDLSDMFSRFLGGTLPAAWSEGAGLAPFGVDIREDADHIYVEADLPGFKKDEVDISLENGMLTIVAEKSAEGGNGKQGDGKESRRGDYLLRERRYQRFQRSFTLPSSVDEQQVHAKLDGGCLCITLNKTEASKPRKIQVS